MSDLNRRQLLAGAAAAGAVTVLIPFGSSTAHAAVPPTAPKRPVSTATRWAPTNAPRSMTARVRSRCRTRA